MASIYVKIHAECIWLVSLRSNMCVWNLIVKNWYSLSQPNKMPSFFLLSRYDCSDFMTNFGISFICCRQNKRKLCEVVCVCVCEHFAQKNSETKVVPLINPRYLHSMNVVIKHTFGIIFDHRFNLSKRNQFIDANRRVFLLINVQVVSIDVLWKWFGIPCFYTNIRPKNRMGIIGEGENLKTDVNYTIELINLQQLFHCVQTHWCLLSKNIPLTCKMN